MSAEGLLPQHIRNLIMSKDIEAIATVLTSYQDALNASSTDQVMKLYAPDCVFMPQHSPASVGPDAIRDAYDGLFSAITLRVRENIEEIVPTNANSAFARTSSVGTATTKSGQEREEANQELFVFQKVDDEWRIARYCFCTTKPSE